MAEKAKILICDDEQGIRTSLEFILRKKYELAFTNDGAEALEHIKNQPTDILLLDIKLPGMDGIKVLKEAKKISPEIKVIIITGYSSTAIAYRAINTGASDYITKPFDRAHLLDAIEKALSK